MKGGLIVEMMTKKHFQLFAEFTAKIENEDEREKQIKGWIRKIVEIPYTGEADKKLVEQSLKMLVESIEGAKIQNARVRVGGGF